MTKISNYKVPFDTWLNPKVKIKKSPLGGRGMFTNMNIKKGEKVIIWGGTWGEDYMNKKGAEEKKKEGYIIMQWDNDLYSAEKRGDSEGYFVNHSCNPNIWMVDAFTLTARRDIKKGDEITVDYAMMEADEDYVSKWDCNCGNLSCRKKITGKDWRLPELQKRYKGHFSPLINKRIRDNIAKQP